MVIFRSFKLNMELRSKKNYAAYIGTATIGQPIVGALWTIYGFLLFGIIPPESVAPAIIGWIGGGMVVSILIGIPLLRAVTPVVRKTSLFRDKIL